jgi:hypothetical protein
MHACRRGASRPSTVAEFVGIQFLQDPPSWEGDLTGQDLADWIGRLARGWAGDGPGVSTLTDQWKLLATALAAVAPTLRALDYGPRDDPHRKAPLPADEQAGWDEDLSSLRDLTAPRARSGLEEAQRHSGPQLRRLLQDVLAGQ